MFPPHRRSRRPARRARVVRGGARPPNPPARRRDGETGGPGGRRARTRGGSVLMAESSARAAIAMASAYRDADHGYGGAGGQSLRESEAGPAAPVKLPGPTETAIPARSLTPSRRPASNAGHHGGQMRGPHPSAPRGRRCPGCDRLVDHPYRAPATRPRRSTGWMTPSSASRRRGFGGSIGSGGSIEAEGMRAAVPEPGREDTRGGACQAPRRGCSRLNHADASDSSTPIWPDLGACITPDVYSSGTLGQACPVSSGCSAAPAVRGRRASSGSLSASA